MQTPFIKFLVLASGLLTALLSAQSVSQLQIQQVAANQFNLVWHGESLRPYQLEGGPDLMTWMEIGPIQVGADALLGYTQSNTYPHYYYRVRKGAIRPGFDDVEFGRNDDKTYPDTPLAPAAPVPVAIGFSVNFFGEIFSQCYVNNNGNISFGSDNSIFTPVSLYDNQKKIIAPFWADVDTRGINSDVVRFSGQSRQVNGRQTFGVTYKNVGYYDQMHDKLNSFQIILIDRADVSSGDFDVEFNYDSIRWETGDLSGGSMGLGGSTARVGVSSGVGQSLEYHGSGETLKFLDVDPSTGNRNYQTGLIYQTFNSGVPGRILVPFRSGLPPVSFTLDAGPDRILDVSNGSSFQLSGSTNPPVVSGVTFEWTNLSSLDATFSDPTVLNPTVNISEPGNYKFGLTARKTGVFNETLNDEVTVSHPAVFQVDGGYYQRFAPASLDVQLNQATASFTGDLNLSFKWTQTDGDPATINDVTMLHPTVTLPGPGVYVFSLEATTSQNPPFVQSADAFIEYLD